MLPLPVVHGECLASEREQRREYPFGDWRTMDAGGGRDGDGGQGGGRQQGLVIQVVNAGGEYVQEAESVMSNCQCAGRPRLSRSDGPEMAGKMRRLRDKKGNHATTSCWVRTTNTAVKAGGTHFGTSSFFSGTMSSVTMKVAVFHASVYTQTAMSALFSSDSQSWFSLRLSPSSFSTLES
jgi:hypothetical protein